MLRRWRTATPARVGRSGAPRRVDARLEDAIALRQYPAPSVWQLPAVVAGRGLIADTVGQLRLVAVRGGQPRPDQPGIVRQPDPSEPRWLTLHKLCMHLTRHGVGYLWVTARDPAGVPVAVRVLDPAEVAPVADDYGRPVAVTWSGLELALGVDVIEIPLDVDADAAPPTSPLVECWPVLEGIAAFYGYQRGLWAEWGVPSSVISVPHRINRGEADELRAEWLDTHKGRRVPAVLWGGATVTPFSGDTGENTLAAANDAAVAEVARALRIPPSLLNARAGDSLTYSTTEGQFRAWLITGLAAYLMRIEAAFSALLVRGTDARFDTAELLRSDLAGRWAAYSTALAGAPFLAVDEVRALEGLAPMGEVPETPAAVAPAPADPFLEATS